MRRLFSYTLAVTALATAVVAAQKVTTPEELDKAMKRIAPAQGATNKAIQSMSWADAKAQVAIVKQALMDTESFWAANKKDDAVTMLKDSIAKVTLSSRRSTRRCRISRPFWRRSSRWAPPARRATSSIANRTRTSNIA